MRWLRNRERREDAIVATIRDYENRMASVKPAIAAGLTGIGHPAGRHPSH